VYRPFIRPGDTVVYELIRDGRRLTVPVVMGSHLDNLPLLFTCVGLFLLAVFFWIVGLVVCLFAPDDVRARLVGMLWLLGALAMAAGGPGTLAKFWGAYTVMETAWCFLGLTFVAVHLYFPRPNLVAHHRTILNGLAAVAVLLSALVVVNEWALNPRGLSLPYVGGIGVYELVYGFFFLSILASVGLLLRNYVLSRGEVRRQIGIVFWGTVLGFAPFFTLDVVPHILFNRSYANYVSVLFLVLMPLAYTYVVCQRKLLRVDFIINRAVVFFVLILLILTVSVAVLGLVALALDVPPEFSLVGGIVTALIALPSAGLREPVQRRVNQVLYGCHYDFPSVTSSFAGRLARTLDHDSLVGLLSRDLAQKMGIRRTALFFARGDALERQDARLSGEAGTLAIDGDLCRWLLDHGKPARAAYLQHALSAGGRACPAPGYDWVRLFVPLVFENRLVGVLMLGERAAGDVYGDDDVRLVATIAQQAALAFANVELVERLRGLNRRLVRGDEAHRKRVARDLHDTALQQLFFIKEGLLLDERQDDGRLIELLDDTIGALRRTIRDQRPPLLDQGLLFALQGMVEEMQKLAGATPVIAFSSDFERADPSSPDEERATALYRIAQEAVTNAIKHACANTIRIRLSGEAGGRVRLCVEDDGIGLSAPAFSGVEHHYGLVGMQERAVMIGALLEIVSAPGEGTGVRVEVGV
jgi:signal transduction histidine kinase